MKIHTIVCTLLSAALLAPAVMAQAAQTEELKLKLPKPMFIGTPTNIKSANLEAVTGKPRAPFMVPVGTKLLSLKRPVTSSDRQPVIGELGKQWVQIDLGARYALQAIVAWHYHSQARVYRDVIVQVSDDKDFLKGVTTIFNNDHENSSGLGIGKDKEFIEVAEGKLFDAKAVAGRYVRMYSNGNTVNDLNHYVEVEVYGTPVK